MHQDARIYLESSLLSFGPPQPLNELIVAVSHHPDDGAQFCAVWQREPQPVASQT